MMTIYFLTATKTCETDNPFSNLPLCRKYKIKIALCTWPLTFSLEDDALTFTTNLNKQVDASLFNVNGDVKKSRILYE